MNNQSISSLNELRSKRKNVITSHNKIKHLTKKYKRFRNLKEKNKKKLDLDQLFKTRSNRFKKETNKELNFSNFFSKLNEINELNKRNLITNLNDDDDLNNRDNNQNLINSNNNYENEIKSNLIITNEDSENHLLELIKASSTITNHKIQRNQISSLDNQFYNNLKTATTTNATSSSTIINLNKKESKKNLAAKHKERTISLLNEFNRYDNELDLKENKLVNEDLLIDYYLNKLKEHLTKDEQFKFLNYLEEFDLVTRKLIDLMNKQELKNDDCLNDEEQNQQQNLNQSIKEIYSKIKVLLNENSSNNNELIDEFVLFMNYEIVKQLDKQFDFNYWIRIKNFTQKLVIYLIKNSNSLVRLIKLLKQLKQNENDLIDKKKIKAVLNKFLNSQPYLLNELNSLFLEEQPLDYLFEFNEDFDEIDLDEEINNFNNFNNSTKEYQQKNRNYFKFETINLRLTDEEKNCKFCHNQQLDNSHCLSCSLKYCKNNQNSKLFTSIEYIDKIDKIEEEILN